ncbi:hypothetical protein ACEWY4_013426 [Coilia grayii]|uniref:Uncharacterized protein n=1 Tax=Coilia grayii TaxID=363190 RepID=A0ABD1JWA1_9TELE
MWKFLLTLILLTEGESALSPEEFCLIGPDGSVSAPVGSSVTLPCALSPSFSAVPLQVRWYRPDALETLVLLYEKRQVQTKPVDPLYQGRASLVGDLEKGEVSLRLNNLTFDDRGQYVCFVKSSIWYSDLYINLTVKDEEGLMGVGSWLLFSPSQSEWLSCSVGLSDQETTESRVALHTRTEASVYTNESGSAKNLKHPDPPTVTDESMPLNDCNKEKADFCTVPVHLQPEKTADAAEQQAQTTDSVTTMEIVVTTIAVNLDVDVETVPPFLKVQDNYTSVYCPNSQKAFLTEKKIFHADPLKASITDTALPHALCNKCFSSGKHYWEVRVGGHSKQSWYVGVCTIDAVQTDRVSLHPENGFWVLHYERGTGLFANTQPPTKVHQGNVLGGTSDTPNHTPNPFSAEGHPPGEAEVPQTPPIPTVQRAIHLEKQRGAAAVIAALAVTEGQRDAVQLLTHLQRHSSDWMELRRGWLTVSHFGYALATNQDCPAKSVLKRIMGHQCLDGVKAVQWGIDNEGGLT